MNYAIRYGLMVIACGVLLAGVARAENNDASVSDGPSRGELFEARMRADLGPNFGSLSASATRAFVLPSDVLGDAIYGIDVSHHNDENCVCKAGQKCNQCKIDWSQVPNQKVAFAYIKATQGTKFVDPTFEYHWRALAQNKIPRGTYHFMSADEDPVDQADHFVDKLEDAGKLTAADLPPCLDLESDLRKDMAKKWIVVSDSGEKLDFWKGQEPDEILGKVLKWLNRVEQRTGRIPIIYTSRGWWNDRIKDEKKFAQLKRYPIWIANYPESGRPTNDSPKVPNGQAWALWQFTEIGKMKSSDIVPGNLDVNIFKGTLVNFRRAMGVSVTDTTEVARADDSKDAPAQQAAGANPSQPADANKSDQQVASISQSQATDASNPAQQAADANPSQPVDANKPIQQTTSANTAQTPVAGGSAQQAASLNPSQQTGASIVVAQQGTAPGPSQTPSANNPVQQTPATDTAQKPVASNPAQQAATGNPSQPADANKLAQQAAGANPSQATDVSKPPEQTTASVNPTEKKDIADPGNQPANVGPTEPAQNAGTNNPKANSSIRTPPSKRASRAQKTVPDKTTADETAADKVMVEIVLLNGRVLRVDANIDPGVLSRLIAAVDN